MENSFVEVLKIIVFSSVLFVWVVRYQNIIEEFKKYGYPAWLRDIVGITKISFVILLLNSTPEIVRIGSAGIVLLMVAALGTHLKVGNKFSLMIPSFSLLCACAFIFTQQSP